MVYNAALPEMCLSSKTKIRKCSGNLLVQTQMTTMLYVALRLSIQHMEKTGLIHEAVFLKYTSTSQTGQWPT